MSVENLTEEELGVLQTHYQTMADITRKASDLRKSHSVEEAIKEASQKLEDREESGHTL